MQPRIERVSVAEIPNAYCAQAERGFWRETVEKIRKLKPGQALRIEFDKPLRPHGCQTLMQLARAEKLSVQPIFVSTLLYLLPKAESR